ncbi:hypothetical protein EJ110_NYTH06053 [Nymphaea thermarum]|nr:hypothetical protein EJ110_NYTH06053 [Nymphaea thermarum]
MADRRGFSRPRTAGPPPQLPYIPAPLQPPGLLPSQPPGIETLLHNGLLYSTPGNPNFVLPSRTFAVPLPSFGSTATTPNGLPLPVGLVGPVGSSQLFANPNSSFNPTDAVGASFRPSPTPAGGVPPSCPGGTPGLRFPNSNHRTKSKEVLDAIDRAVQEAQQEVLAAGECVSTWKITQAALLRLSADSLESVGFHFQEVPTLRKIMSMESKVNAFIHCFVAVRRIVSLHDLDVEICKREGVGKFEELGMGSLLRQPLIKHYFSVPSDTKEIFKISSDQIIYYLSEFIITCKEKDIPINKFLEFMMEKFSISTPEKLCIRIHGVGLYISLIREARKSERTAYEKFLQTLKHDFDARSHSVDKARPPSKYTQSQKQKLDKRFNAISERIMSFSSDNKDFKPKHIRFASSSSDNSSDDVEDDDSDENNYSCGVEVKSSGTKSSCPYPSAEEERTRLGLNAGNHGSNDDNLQNGKFSGKKRKCDGGVNNSYSKKKTSEKGKTDAVVSDFKVRTDKIVKAYGGKILQKKDEDPNNFMACKVPDEQDNFNLTDKSLQKFITTWKESCREQSTIEVFNNMLLFYKGSSSQSEHRKIRRLFSSYPGLGLLNVAVTSMKRGMWDSLYDSFQVIDVDGLTKERSTRSIEAIEVEPSAKCEVPSSGSDHYKSHEIRVCADDICKMIIEYFSFDTYMQGERTDASENKSISLRGILGCETWIAKKFSVEKFALLGYGEFIEFLDKYMPSFSSELCNHLLGGEHKRNPISVSMHNEQLSEFISQTMADVNSSNILTTGSVSILLKKQFPSMSLQVMGNNSDEFIDLLKQKKLHASRNVVYSAALLETSSYIVDSLVPRNGLAPNPDGMVGEFKQKVGSHGAASGKDAIECLLKAPMFSDLLAWSHWDILYAPSLGPLLEWLSSECYNKELLCLVTRDGKVIRIDHSATVDQFLEAAIHASSFKTAVSFLSILALYGGMHHAPVSLLKCHACHAIEVILKNAKDLQEVNCKYKFSVLGKASPGSSIYETSSYSSFTFEGSHSKVKLKHALTENINKLDEGVTLVARFILDFLFYLPSEFRACAGEVFLSGLRSTIPDAYSVILDECLQVDQFMMLHDLGLSLGIIDWISHYHAFTTSEHHAVSSNCHTNRYFKDPAHSADHACERFNGAVSKGIPFADEDESHTGACNLDNGKDMTADCIVKHGHDLILSSKSANEEGAYYVIESIRREEFGLDSSLACAEANLLKKQHARLGRALCCLSRDLYSQDSHFILELVQNADDNIYSKDVDATLAFILQPDGIVVLNNEEGFTAENIRALCDVGNSTKKGSATGYIGHKGIGFKSVFRVTDAPEIHSNGYHVKFDISEGQIGFVLPTAIPPCDVNLVGMLVSADNQADDASWNTCIVLPFKPAFKEAAAMRAILSMFSDLHPSLLLFLHRLQCIKLKNMINDSLTVFRRERVGNGLVTVTHGDEKMTWLVVQSKLKANSIRPGVQTTEIALAFTLKESSNGEYVPQLIQQPVFAFLPLRTYGLKFILQGDFVLPSSREEVDGNSAWNQWLLSEFPGLFLISERSFCDLPCFKDNPAKAVSVYMAFVPLMGEVHGFFSNLPQFIISRLRMSNCLLLDTQDVEWVPPCRVLKGWNDEVRLLLPDKLLHDHLGLGYLHKDIVLSDPLSEALGVQSYGPSILIDIMRSVCTKEDVKLLGMNWLVSWLCILHDSLLVCSSDFQIAFNSRKEPHYINDLKRMPFLPLSDGSCSSLSEGPIWLPCDMLFSGHEDDQLSKCFPTLYAKLRTVNPALFTEGIRNSETKESQLSILVQMLLKIGVQRMSAHELVWTHILPTISGGGVLGKEKELMVEYLVFIMHHMQSCSSCKVERSDIMAKLQKEAVVLTNNGFKCPLLEPVHFGKEFKNPVDMSKLIGDLDIKWNEVDCIYLNYSGIQSLSLGVEKWREFFEQLGITDFVQIKHACGNSSNSKWSANLDMVAINVEDWECPELWDLLSALSSKKDREKCMYLLSTLDMLWDDIFGAKVSGYCASNSVAEKIRTKSCFLKSIHQFRWIASSLDKELHFPANMFYNCEAVQSIFGAHAPYAVPQVNNRGLINALGFKIQVTIRDALMMLHSWQASKHFIASVGQMSKFYSFIWNEISRGNMAELELLSGPFVFVPLTSSSNNDEVIAGAFLSPQELCWQDPAGAVDLIRESNFENALIGRSKYASCLSLCHVYPHLHDFFVKQCLVTETPKFGDYVKILRKLSSCALPSQAAACVLRVLQKWADDIKFGLVGPKEISQLKECLSRSENTVLPTVQDKWVSLHPDFGFICWCDDEDLKQQFNHNNIYFLYFGLTNNEENKLVPEKLAAFMQAVGIPALSEIVSREAVFYGLIEGEGKFPLISWLLPYAQRYLYRFHRETYSSLKKSEFHSPSHLRVITVESLFYRRVLKGCENTSKERFECSCLLQGNILYVTKAADYHSIFLELSRLFFGGSSDLHLANFLHMVTSMAECGSTEEQIELFVVNSQMVPKLPDDEQAWVLDYPLSSPVLNTSMPSLTLPPTVQASSISKHKLLKPGISLHWPPTDWRTCPSFRRAHEHNERDTSRPYQADTLEEKLTIQIDNLLAEYDSTAYAALTSNNVHHTEGLLEIEAPKGEQKKKQAFHSTELLIGDTTLHLDTGSSTFNDRDQLQTGNPSVEHTHRTGRVGELIAFKYFTEKHGYSAIKWVNEDVETGLPYDIIITEEDDSVQYIEVKATSSPKKDWFEMSANEWLFAVQNGDSYSIARVVLSPPEQSRISLFKNPVKLCQKDVLRLAILMPRNH